MTDINPSPSWAAVRQLEIGEFASGGANGNMNEQAKALAGQNMYSRLYAGLPFDPVFNAQVGGFPIGGKAALENGDIVRSTVANNTVDPNVDMTGWVIPYLVKSSNLDDVPDKATARNNLDVYSQTEVDNAIANATPTIPNATETVAGKAKIATTAIAQAGVNDTDFMTSKKVKDQVSTGGRIHATAYVSVVGPVVTILSSKNIASVVLQSTGVFKVTTLTDMDNLNFSIAATSSLLNGEGGSTGIFAEWLNTNGTNKRTLNSFEMVSLGTQGLGNPRYFGVTVIC